MHSLQPLRLYWEVVWDSWSGTSIPSEVEINTLIVPKVVVESLAS